MLFEVMHSVIDVR